jgi:cyclopropane fatty-acyl-phospholipid synthase-like methyltransferase
MGPNHKAGCDSRVDYATVVVFLLWVAMTIFLIVFLVVRGNVTESGVTTPPVFIDKYVFPDGELVPLNVTVGAAESAKFEVRDVESLREHYALTLRQWVRRLESRAERARRIVGETTYRVWRLYMAGSAHAFTTGRLNLYQVLLSKPAHGESHLPLTREDWYS